MIKTIHIKAMSVRKGSLFLTAFALLCACCLFADGLPLIDSDIESKWFGALFLIFAMGMFLPYGMRMRAVSFRAMDLAVGILFAWVVVRSIGHVTLLYYLRLAAVGVLYVMFWMVGRSYAKATGITVAVLTVVLALFGLGQWLHIIPNGGSAFPVVGTFDNPAGYASSLAIGVPFVLPFVKDERRGVRVAAVGSLLLVLTVLVATESRAALLATLAVLVLWATSSSRRPVGTFWKVAVPVLLAAALVGMYFLKKDSADGRLLIWWVTLGLIARHPIAGGGTHAFWRAYMPAQADFFRLHPDSRFALLADNVRHPFNEYLSVLLQWGVVGFVLLAVVVLLAIQAWRSHHDRESDTSLLALVALGIVASFSYPMNYPFAWIILMGGLATLGSATPAIKVLSLRQTVSALAVTLASVTLFATSAVQYRCYSEWHSVAHHRPAVKMEKLAETYEKLLPHMKRDSYFLNNYAAELYYHKWYEEAAGVLEEVAEYRCDYDILHLKGDLRKDQQLLSDARDSYSTMSYMCPNRYLPLFRLFKIAVYDGDYSCATILANAILKMQPKVLSPQMTYIQENCSSFLLNS